MDQQKIGSFLRELRKAEGISQEQFAEKLNVTGRTVSRWETGKTMPDISMLIEVAEYYDVSIPEIINGERMSKEMENEEKQVVKSLAEYSDVREQKRKRKLMTYSVIGVVLGVICSIIETVNSQTIDFLVIVRSLASTWLTAMCLDNMK